MKTRYQFIHFNDLRETGTFDCCSNRDGTVLGSCSFFKLWGQWVFSQSGSGRVLSADCLLDVAHFMNQLPKP